MGLYAQLPEHLQEVDVVIAGGGTAGCTVAGRLAEADPNLSILLIEGGPDNYNEPSIVNPAVFHQHLAPNSKNTIFWQPSKSPHTLNSEQVVASGGVLGGGSSINFCMYVRSQRSDFDSWKTPGWSAEELIPFLKKNETFHGKGDPSIHGYEGPIHVSDGGFRSLKPENDFVAAAVQVGFSEVADGTDLTSSNNVARWLRFVSPDGKRQDAAHTFIHPLLRDGKHPNLHVLVETQVVRVLFDQDKRASGVEFVRNPIFQPLTNVAATPSRTIRAGKLVVLSCGALATPGVLERSGVGSEDILKRAGVPVVANIPGVGNDYQDHQLVVWPYYTSLEPHETADDIVSGRLSIDDAIAAGNKATGWNSLDAAVKARPTDDEVVHLGPAFQAAWNADFKHNPSKPLCMFASLARFLGDPSAVPPGQYFTVASYTMYPYSRGHIHITGPALTDRPDFETGMLSDPNDIDLKKHIWAYKKHREIVRRCDFYRGEVAYTHPEFPAGSKAACVQLSEPKDVTEDLEYSAEDDRAIEQRLRENMRTCWHSLGTAKMAPLENMGAVDKDLSVYGVRGLKVVDMSIVPENVGANTNNTAFLVGEKGADIIMRELGLVKKDWT